VLATPDVTALALTRADEFLLVACDGLFDVTSSEDAVAAARAHVSPLFLHC
jgi:serine/threonine protein phosphatase PrpC